LQLRVTRDGVTVTRDRVRITNYVIVVKETSPTIKSYLLSPLRCIVLIDTEVQEGLLRSHTVPSLRFATHKKTLNVFFFEKINRRTGQCDNQGNKLRTYAKIKFHYKLENYLISKLSRNVTIEIAKLRTSTHNLLIETRRHCRPVIPSSERKCKMCASVAIEDEIHLVVQCTAYSEMRKRLLKKIADTKQIEKICRNNDYQRRKCLTNVRQVFARMLPKTQGFSKHVTCVIIDLMPLTC